jgi:RNA polymerase sigma factor (sigma-70 family)
MSEQRTDFELLRDFARAGDQAAFATLTRRHLDLVFATAVRKTGDASAAEEVAQNVFLALGRKAWQFAPDDSLPAWLHRAALLESKEWLRGELRRRRREQAAAELVTTMNTPDEQPALRALLPLLDEALLSLREKERAALLLRFYENQPLRQVGAALGIGEDAAQKRVAAAVQKLTAFFQRRGFKTATIAVTVAALRHTAVSAPVAVTASVAEMAVQVAPPAIGGLLALAGRWMTMTRLQTAAACLALAAVPVTWQLCEQRQATAEAERAGVALASAQAELEREQVELERLRRRSTELAAEVKQAGEAAQRTVENARQFEEWKEHLRELLTARDYRWPADSPFVRIPKSLLDRLQVHRPISPPGLVQREARELLGLTPEERQQLESALQKHFATVDGLAETAVVETNASQIHIPGKAIASQAWVVPALGEQVKASADALQATLRNLLGQERWPVVQAQLKAGDTQLRRVLNFDAGERPQAMTVWLSEQNGKTTAFGWSGLGAPFSSAGVSLDQFLPGHPLPVEAPPGTTPLECVGAQDLLPALTKRVQNWLEEQALRRVIKENGQ